MGGGIDRAQRLNTNRGVAGRRLSEKEIEHLCASIIPDTNAEYIESVYKINKRAKSIIRLAERRFESFRSASDKGLKHRYAKEYLAIYEFASVLAEESPVLEDNSLAEGYQELVFDLKVKGEYDVVEKLRPWTPERPKKLSDIPEFKVSRIIEVSRWLQGYSSHVEMEPTGEFRRKPGIMKKGSLTPQVYVDPPVDADTALSTGSALPVFKVKYKISAHFKGLILNPGTSIYALQDESLALAILAFSVDRTMSIASARNIARTYLERFPEDRKFLAGKDYYDKLRGIYSGPYSDEELEQIFGFSYSSATILAHDFQVKIGENVLRELTGETQREMARKFQLYRIDESLKKYFVTAAAEDFAKVLHAVTRSRFLMVSYFRDDFQELKNKRAGGWGIIKKYESIFLSNQFPAEGEEFLVEAAPRFKGIHNTIKLGSQEAKSYTGEEIINHKNEFFELAIESNREILTALQDLQAALSNYEQDKVKWGNRVLVLLTLGLELAIAYFTAGLGARLSPLIRTVLGVAEISLTQAFYRYVGITDKLSATGLARDIATGMLTGAAADKFAERFVNESGRPLASFNRKVIHNIVSNFVAALEQEVLSRAMGKSMDDFLMDMLTNFSTGVIHSKVANKAMDRSIARLPAKLPLPENPAIHQKHTSLPVVNDPPRDPGDVVVISDKSNRAVENTLTPGKEVRAAFPDRVVPRLEYASLNERITLMHGTSSDIYRKINEADGFKFDPENQANSDFGAGVYFTFDVEVAQSAAQRKTKGLTAILVFELYTPELGKIVDIRPGGKHYEPWMEHLNEDAGLPKIPGMKSLTNADILRLTVEKRAEIFDQFLKNNGLEEADTVIGPLGDEFTTGTAVPVNRQGIPQVSTQVVIRSMEVLERLNSRIRDVKNREPFTGKKENEIESATREPIDLNDSREHLENDREPVSNQAGKPAAKKKRRQEEPDERTGAKPDKKKRESIELMQSRSAGSRATSETGIRSVRTQRRLSAPEQAALRNIYSNIRKHLAVLTPVEADEIRGRQSAIQRDYKKGHITAETAITRMTAVLNIAKGYSGVPVLEAVSLGLMEDQRNAPVAERANGVPVFDLDKLNNRPEEQIQEVIGEAKGGRSARLSFSNRVYYTGDGLPVKGPVAEKDKDVVLEGSGEWLFNRIMETRSKDRARARQIFEHIKNGRLRFIFTRSVEGKIVGAQDITDHINDRHVSITEYFRQEMYKSLYKGEI